MKEIYIVKLDETMISRVGYETIEQAQNFIKSRIENDTHTVEDWNSPLAVQWNRIEKGGKETLCTAHILPIQIEEN